MPKPELSGGTPGWMPLGACRGEDPELFFPVTLAGPALMPDRLTVCATAS